MRKIFLPLIALFSGVALIAPASLAQEAKAPLRVNIDEAKIAQIPDNAVTLVVGNPIVADVTMLKGSNAMVLTGKSYGETNVIALDAKGNVLDEEQIRVLPALSHRTLLVVQRGDARQSYSCDPNCMPSIELGDDADWFEGATKQVGQRTGLAHGQAAAASASGGSGGK